MFGLDSAFLALATSSLLFFLDFLSPFESLESALVLLVLEFDDLLLDLLDLPDELDLSESKSEPPPLIPHKPSKPFPAFEAWALAAPSACYAN